MDHFVLPEGKAHIRIPNLTTEKYTYTEGSGGFEGYPARAKWSLEEIASKSYLQHRPTKEVQSFFQSWLYFGCAIEVLAISGVNAKHSDFLTSDGRYVSTEKLPSMIRRWRQRVMQIGSKSPKECITLIIWAMKTALVLKKVSSYVDEYCLPYDGPPLTTEMKNARIASSPLPQKVWMSIIALGHTLTAAMISYYDIRRIPNNWGASALLRNRMLKKGWCPMDVERSLLDMGIDGHYYIAKKKNPETNISHTYCTKTECVGRNIEEKTYEQIHDQDCDQLKCEGFINADIDRLVEIIKADGVPVFKWDEASKSLEIASSANIKRGSSDPPYVAISHVWSDGMGNPEDNALRPCQLKKVQELVASAAESAKLKGNPQYFWMDTLCVPVGKQVEMKKLRGKCIRHMASIYEGGAAVLVLSSTFRYMPSTASEHEIGIAYYLSNWHRRLWTFQEGMLAENLLIQFSDKAFDYRNDGPSNVNDSVENGYCVTFPKQATIAVMAEFVILRDFLRDGLFENPGDPKAVLVGPLAPAISVMHSRSTSKKSDETICLGTLMHVPLEELQRAEAILREQKGIDEDTKLSDDEVAEKRMEIFWSLVNAFSPNVIFNSHKRLSKAGFRWAPGTLLGSPRRGFVKTVEGKTVSLDKKGRGLSVPSPGIIFSSPTSWSTNTRSVAIKITHKDFGELHLRVDTTNINYPHQAFSWLPSTRYAILLSEPISRRIRESSRTRNESIPTTGPELETWLEDVFHNPKGNTIMLDAVIATIQETYRHKGSSKETVQIRHECIGTATLLNSSSSEQLRNARDSGWDAKIKEFESFFKDVIDQGRRHSDPGRNKLPGYEDSTQHDSNEEQSVGKMAFVSLNDPQVVPDDLYDSGTELDEKAFGKIINQATPSPPQDLGEPVEGEMTDDRAKWFIL